MLGSVLDDVFYFIGDNVYSLTGEDLYAMKREFYKKSAEYMGHSKNLTGVTELLTSMYLKQFLKEKDLPLGLEPSATRAGENGQVNEVDIAFIVPESKKIIVGFSIKNEIGTTDWKKHELNSDYCQHLRNNYGKKNLAQDLFRLENIKRGSHGSFNSFTVIFEPVKTNDLKIMNKIKRDFPNHTYIVLAGGKQPLWNLFEGGLQNVNNK